MSQKNVIAKRNTPVVMQTGPTTLAGKQVSSKNAQKGAIFTKGYLQSENIEQKQAEYEALTEQWGAYDPTRQMILRTIEQANLGIERQMLFEKQKIEALMQSADVAQQFARHAGLSTMAATMMPAWYFSDGGVREKRIAASILKVFEQVEQLIHEYSDQIAPHIKTRYPDLYAYLMEGQAVTAQFLIVLGITYKQTTAILNLHKLIEGLEKHHYHHLVWAKEADRYQILVMGLRAQKIEEAIDLDKSNRYATNLQSRLLKGVNALVTLDQIDAHKISAAQTTVTISEQEQGGGAVSLEAPEDSLAASNTTRSQPMKGKQ